MVLERERPGVVGFHFYNPIREGKRIGLHPQQTSPDGIDWLERVLRESYFPLAQKGIYKLATYDVYCELLNHELPRVMAMYAAEGKADGVAMAQTTIDAMKSSLAENGVGSTYAHSMISDRNTINKRFLIHSGYKQFIKDSGGTPPQFLWTPESGLDIETVQIAAEVGYRGILCAPHQVRLESGELAGVRPTKLKLPKGGELIALPFHKGTSQAIAFADKYDAPLFADKYIVPAYSDIPDEQIPVVTYTDGETLGHWWKYGEYFAKYLLEEALPKRGVKLTSVNKLEFPNLPEGFLQERTAWSCLDGDLARWKGPCQCCKTNDGKWKTPFHEAHRDLNNSITKLVQSELGLSDDEFVKILSDDFGTYLENSGPPNTDTRTSALSAQASGLLATKSCGTFFDTPGTSGLINITFAMQAIAHLRDSGLTEKADKIENKYRTKMHKMKDPSDPNRRGTDMIDGLLEKSQPPQDIFVAKVA